MNKKSCILSGVLLLIYMLIFPAIGLAKEKKEMDGQYKVPNHVLTISKENTFPNATEDQEIVEPSKLTKSLLDEIDISVENPDLIKLLNETSLKPSPISLGYRGMIYLGRWALHYESAETSVNWEYQQINTNELNNLGGNKAASMNYDQQEKREIKGALTSKITDPDDIKKMMLLKTREKTKFPLSFQTVIGKQTKKENTYNIPAKKQGILEAYAPAVNEKGQVTFGEVYIELKGSKKALVIKNVTKQGIGAWIPIQDHVSFSFQLK